jgi:hypothetical protein
MFVIALDPQLDVRPTNVQGVDEDDASLWKPNRRRRLMSDLASEYAVLRDHLLRELAR